MRSAADIQAEINLHEEQNDGSVKWVDDHRELINELIEAEANENPFDLSDMIYEDYERLKNDQEYADSLDYLDDSVDETNYDPYTGSEEFETEMIDE